MTRRSSMHLISVNDQATIPSYLRPSTIWVEFKNLFLFFINHIGIVIEMKNSDMENLRSRVSQALVI